MASLTLSRREILLRKVGFEAVHSDDPFYSKFRCLNCGQIATAGDVAVMMSLAGILQYLHDHALSCGEQPPVSPTGSSPTPPASPAAAVKTPLDQNDHPTDSGEGEGLPHVHNLTCDVGYCPDCPSMAKMILDELEKEDQKKAGLVIGKPGVQFFVSNWDSKAAEASFQRFLKEYPIKETE